MNQPLYIALEKEFYRKSKANILASEIAILNSMKHLYAIRQTQLQQQALRKKVFEAFEFIKQRIDRLAETKLPEIKDIPKTKYPKEQIRLGTDTTPSTKKGEKSTVTQKEITIEEELRDIQTKLEMLNR